MHQMLRLSIIRYTRSAAAQNLRYIRLHQTSEDFNESPSAYLIRFAKC